MKASSRDQTIFSTLSQSGRKTRLHAETNLAKVPNLRKVK